MIMPFQDFRSARSLPRVMLVVSVMAIQGCTVGGRSFSIDSTSRVPFFGLELRGRKPKSDGPAFRSIRFERSLPFRVKPLGFSSGESRRGASVVAEGTDVTVRATLPITPTTGDASRDREPLSSSKVGFDAVDFR